MFSGDCLRTAIVHFIHKRINDIKQIKTSEYELLCCDNSLEKASKRLLNAIHEVSKYFDHYKLNLDAKKTNEFLVFCRKHQNQLNQKQSIKVQNETIQAKASVKYLGVFLDQNLCFQEEVKSNLKKWLLV